MTRMNKYTVNVETFEFDPTRYATAEEAYMAYDDHNDKEVGIFDTIEEARKELEKISVSTYRFSYKVARATAAWIEEGEYCEEDGKLCFLGGVDVWNFKFEETPNCR